MTGTCQVCGSAKVADYVRHDEGRYPRCPDCGLIFNAQSDQLFAQALRKYDSASYFAGYERRLARKLRAAREQLDLVQTFVASGTLLNIGCGAGDTLVAAREAGSDAIWLDVGAYSVRHCRKLGFDVIQASLTDIGLRDASVDVVAMWDVLEHIPCTAAGLREVARVLRPDGIAAAVVPSGEYLKAHLLRRTHQNYRGEWAKTHFVYHNERTLRRVFAQSGLKPRRLPLLHRGALRRGAAIAACEAAVALPRYLFGSIRSGARLTRNLFVVAVREPA